MNPRDLFGLVLRLVCLVLAIWGVWSMLSALNYLISLALAISPVAPSLDRPFGYFIYGFPAFLFGITGLRFADSFVNFTYRRQATTADLSRPAPVGTNPPPKLDSPPPLA